MFDDIYSYNDYSYKGENRALNKKKIISKTDKPYLVSEYGGYMLPTKKFDNESRRRQQALRHLEVLEVMESDDEILGAAGWSMFDYNTARQFGSGDNIAYYGVMDMYRIPKYAAYVYSSQQNMYPIMNIASSMNPGDYDGSLLDDIYVFTNCDYIKLYKNNQFIGSYYPDKKRYPSLEHPPIIIEDLIGDSLEREEGFSRGDARRLKDLLISYSKSNTGFTTMDNIKMGRLLLKYKLDMIDAEKLYIKHLGLRGSPAYSYRFEGYVGKQCVMRKTKGKVDNPKLKMLIDNKELVEDITYDVTRVVIKLVDDYDNDLVYANDVITIDTEGPIEIIGPKSLALIGGSIGFWIKTNGGAGSGKILLDSERYGSLEEEIEVF